MQPDQAIEQQRAQAGNLVEAGVEPFNGLVRLGLFAGLLHDFLPSLEDMGRGRESFQGGGDGVAWVVPFAHGTRNNNVLVRRAQ